MWRSKFTDLSSRAKHNDDENELRNDIENFVNNMTINEFASMINNFARDENLDENIQKECDRIEWDYLDKVSDVEEVLYNMLSK